MDIHDARKLSFDLRRQTRQGGLKLRAEVVDDDQLVAVVGENGRARWQFVECGRVVFKGGKSGDHSLDVQVSSLERILAHWEGYCEANGLLKPKQGQLVDFPSGSSRSGWRTGRVLKVGSKRAVVAFTYKHGGKSTKTVPFNELRL